MYCTYEQYRTFGGSMMPHEYAIWGLRASRMIDRLTFGRAKRHKDDVPDELADACAQIADILKRGADYSKSDKAMLASANTDGYSASYISAADAEANTQRAVSEALASALGNDPYNLLYQGVGGCY